MPARAKRIWHFQTLHHDLWDHDLPTYPNLVHRDPRWTAAAGGGAGHEDGLCPSSLTERPASRCLTWSNNRFPRPRCQGEAAWPTQPVPTKPPPFSAQSFSEQNVTNIGAQNRAFVLQKLAELKRGPAFNPPSLEGTVVIPGLHGGATWSGASFDPTTGVLYVNSNNVPNILTLVAADPAAGYRFGHRGYVQLFDQEGYPGIEPPWGLLNAIDLNKGEFVWRTPLGEHPELTARGIPQTGTRTFGGSIVTAGGLVFIGGTMDEQFHAFDKTTGQLLWKAKLPAGGYATPCTYTAQGRQFVVVAAGGAGKLRTRPGDAFRGLRAAAQVTWRRIIADRFVRDQ